MIERLIKIILIFLLIFTPLAFGSMELWALTVLELGILAMIALYAIGEMFFRRDPLKEKRSAPGIPADSKNKMGGSYRLPVFLLCLFLALILFQMIPLPPGLLKTLSPKTYELRQQFAFPFEGGGSAYWPISLFPYATKVEFFKWAALIAFFIFLLHWKGLGRGLKGAAPFLITIMGVGIAESLYGIFEFFSGHRHILHIDAPRLVNSVTGTFINPNYFAGYLLMVIPLSIGYLFARESEQEFYYRGWRHRLASLDGKTLLMWFGVLVMILALIFSASRMGIACLLLSFGVITLLFRDPREGKRLSRALIFILMLAVAWAVWLGLDAVVGRFTTLPEDFLFRKRIWENTFQTIKDFPLLGTGLGTFAQVFPKYQSFYLEASITHAENDYLQLASDIGVVGLIVLIVAFAIFLTAGFSKARSLSPSNPRRYIFVGGTVGILALMVFSFFERNIQVPSNALYFLGIICLIIKI
jgi:hypothetical protein